MDQLLKNMSEIRETLSGPGNVGRKPRNFSQDTPATDISHKPEDLLDLMNRFMTSVTTTLEDNRAARFDRPFDTERQRDANYQPFRDSGTQSTELRNANGMDRLRNEFDVFREQAEAHQRKHDRDNAKLAREIAERFKEIDDLKQLNEDPDEERHVLKAEIAKLMTEKEGYNTQREDLKNEIARLNAENINLLRLSQDLQIQVEQHEKTPAPKPKCRGCNEKKCHDCHPGGGKHVRRR